MKHPALIALVFLAAFAASASHAAHFVYEGRLDDSGRPANGHYDLQLTAYGHEAQYVPLAAPVTFERVEVKDGHFHLDLSLEVADQVWLEVAVRGSGEDAFSAISGRSKARSAPLIGTCWSTLGDSGSVPSLNFLGTTDAQPLVLRTQNVQSLRIEPSANLFSGTPITANMIAGSSANGVSDGVRGATISGGGLPTGDSDPDFMIEGPNRVTDAYGTVGGGYANRAGNDTGTATDGASATVSGGTNNTASGSGSTIGGGASNIASGEGGFIGGGVSNTVSGFTNTIAGGSGNISSGSDSTIGGGRFNTASGTENTVGGGFQNAARVNNSTVGGGSGNNARTGWSTVGGGARNSANGVWTTIGGGEINSASGPHSTVSGGYFNNAIGKGSAVGGGEQNCAGGDFSWAGGRLAKVRPGVNPDFGNACGGLNYPGGTGDQGTFVWADSQVANFVSTGPNQFLVRASGGIYLGINSTFEIPANRFINTSTGAHLTTGGAWTNASSRALKTDFVVIDPADVLSRVLRLGVSTWAYRASDEGRHMGPVAEDFHNLFGLGSDDASISTVDASGVALAAIQGLNSKLEREHDVLKAENIELRVTLDRLAAEMAELRAQLCAGGETR